MSTRAMHPEFASDLSTESFIQALERFISRTGSPKRMCSDNGINFVIAEREIKQALRQIDPQKSPSNKTR